VEASFKIAAGGYWYAKEKKEKFPPRIAVNVELEGKCGRGQIRDLYANAYFVVIPLHDVIFSAGATAVIEAMAMGKAVIIAKSKGISDYVEDGKTGLFFEPGNAGDLKEKMRYLLENPGEAKRLGENARKKVEAEMNMERYVSQLAAVIKEVMDE